MASDRTDPEATAVSAGTPEGQTLEEPAAEVAHGDHEDAHGGHENAHGEHEDGLGPIDWRAWGASLLGLAAAALIGLALALPTLQP